MNKFLVICLLVVGSFTASAQTAIKTNALYWSVLLPNVQVETKLADNLTFQGEVNTSFWENAFDGRPMVGAQFIVGARWYNKEEFNGFYLGGDFGFDIYRTSKWIYTPNYIQHGIGYYLGVTVGYQLPLGKRWSIDFYVGGGWHLGKYYGTYADTGEIYEPWNGSGEWIPYKLGVALGFKL